MINIKPIFIKPYSKLSEKMFEYGGQINGKILYMKHTRVFNLNCSQADHVWDITRTNAFLNRTPLGTILLLLHRNWKF